MIDALVLDAGDNVATALRDLEPGETVTARGPLGNLPERAPVEPVAAGHKLALVAIPAGGAIRKYGEVIGVATASIAAGAHVHVHNVKSRRAQRPAP